MSVPNQLIVKIQKPRYKEKFLQIGIDEWIYASKKFPPATFKLYLYLAGNANDFSLELSQQAVENAIGIKKTAYHDGLETLKEAGYLKLIKGNLWSFSPAIPEEEKIKTDSANANTEKQIEVNISKSQSEQKPTVSHSLPVTLEDKDFSADAEENSVSAFEETSSAIQNKSSAKAIEKQIIDNIDKTDNSSLMNKFHNDPLYDFLFQKEFKF